MLKGPIFVAGHRGLVGSALVRKLRAAGRDDLILRTRKELDLTDQGQVRAFFRAERPKTVLLAAAKVGGIVANSENPAPFLYENLAIEVNVIHQAWAAGVERLLFLGSSCIYPKMAPQPLKEEYLLTGPLEPTNEAYAVAKIAGLKLCEHYNRQYGVPFVSVMPTNLYGPGDNFDLRSSHVLPALIRRFDDALRSGADSVTLWGTGRPRREFLHVDDMADAALFVFEREIGPTFVNIGSGEDLPIGDLARLVAKIVGFEGAILWDSSKPDGTPRKLLDVSRLRSLGWSPSIGLEEGITDTVRWYRAERERLLGPEGRS
ncbi:GDP-L-fucose synthase family protein [Aminirod propionatiphilus]|uniref:GDP-L-fucose synthase n=1 Tax=Aminirod propionatiphilus TaxID=3415223 RepID=A0ACD1DX72_9BACT|nr:GDP-L-fucose synthase [Synergistaceae bacterium]QVL36810.1 GDP-L-fucose synthase [Synergistota bacterium]